MDAIVTQMIILFILVIVGYYLSKKKMMDADFDRKLSGLFINVTCPSLILSSVMGDTLPDKELILPLLVVGFATYVVLIGAAFLLPRYLPVKMAARGIYSFMLAFGNVGCIGYPIVASIFGASAVFTEIGKTINVDLGVTVLLGWFVLASLLVNEIRSICENFVEAGYKVPKILTKGLEVAEKVVNKDDETGGE